MKDDRTVSAAISGEQLPAYSRRRKTTAAGADRSAVNPAPEDGSFNGATAVIKEITPMVLVNEISKLFVNKMREQNDNPISGSYRHLVFHLAQKDGRTQLELARLTHLKPPTVSLSLAKLEAEGYIRRETDPVDLRQTRVYLTEKGRQVDEAARSAFIALEKEVVASLSEKEIEDLISILKKIREKL